MNAVALFLSILLLADADIPRTMNLRSTDAAPAPSFSNEEVPLFPAAIDSDQQGTTPPKNAAKQATLQESSKLELIRYVSGEFAKAAKSLPGGKEGFFQYADKPLNQDLLDRAVANHGAAVHAGEKVQITKLEFHDHTIVVDVNGGGRVKKRFLDHIQISANGSAPTMRSTTEAQEAGPSGMQPGAGSTLYLEFGKAIPDLSPEELRQVLSPFLDFSRQRSASVLWIDTLPPDIRKAIQERTARVGMDREMVVAAIGKPGHKVRERDNEGNEIEDWIYGTPPDRTVFVRFTGDKVTSIKQFPQ
jgi:sulfur carrier protein ThiS